MDTEGLLNFTIPQEGYYQSKTVHRSSALVADLPYHALMLHRFIYEANETPEEAKNLSAGPSLPPRTPSPTLDPSLDPNYTLGQGVVTPDANGNQIPIPEIVP